MKKSKVFISCGQKTNKEKQVGKMVVDFFNKKRFDAYFAEDIHSSQALTENIFDALKDSEYCVCLLTKRQKTNTGSLFVQQELAIASFLQIPTLVFYFGRIELEGVAHYLILNAVKVKSISDLLNNLKKLSRSWNNASKNQLYLTFDNPSINVIIQNNPQRPLSDWWHVTVHNRNTKKTAKNCYGYIQSIVDLNSNTKIFSDDDYKTELIWAGTGAIEINLPPLSKRDLDAFYIVHDGSNKVIFQQRATSTFYRYPDLIYGKYKITYIIVTDNFPQAKVQVGLTYGPSGLLINDNKQIL